MAASMALLELCRTTVLTRLNQLEATPAPDAFSDLGFVAETVLAAGDAPTLAPVAQPIATSVGAWVRSGLMQRILMANAEYHYHGAVLVHLAVKFQALPAAELAQFSQLVRGKSFGCAELSSLTLLATTAHLAAIGVVAQPDRAVGWVKPLIDKRVLRRRVDEHDVLALMQVVCLAQVGLLPDEAVPDVLPQVMLTQAAWARNVNWMATLALVVSRLGGGRDGLAWELRNLLATASVPVGTLLPLPETRGADNGFVLRAELGIRLRASLAYCAMLGDS
jgi:hypothetical protein